MRYFKFMFFALLLVGCNGAKKEQQEEPAVAVAVEPKMEYGFCVDSLHVVDGVVENGQNLTMLFTSLGANQSELVALINIPDSVFNVKCLRAGNKYRAYYKGEGNSNLQYVVYTESVVNYVIFDFTDSLKVTRGAKEVVHKNRVGRATIKSSLWEAIESAGLNMQLALDLSDIYAWNIDFFGLQELDSFTVYYDELYVDSMPIKVGTIYAARFYHYGKDYFAFRYAMGDQVSYFDEEGNSLKKAFLKAPLKYSRISSTFTYARMHPIYRTVRPHTGVDYAAPIGTPVVSIGDGVVTERGYKGGGGNTVKIRHNGSYQTAYLHLSKFGPGIAVGSHVSQGQVIGYVGSTGSSTGAHLDFRVWQNGKPVNPLTMESPRVEPIPANCRADYDSVVNVMRQRIG